MVGHLDTPAGPVRIIGSDQPIHAGCASGAWLDTWTGRLWEQLVTPVDWPAALHSRPYPRPIVAVGPADTDLGALQRALEDQTDDGGILFIPEELAPDA